jgi:hypothetical protein
MMDLVELTERQQEKESLAEETRKWKNQFSFPEGCVFPEDRRVTLISLSAENRTTPYSLCGKKSECNGAKSHCLAACNHLA